MVHCCIVLSSVLAAVDVHFPTHLTTKYVGLKVKLNLFTFEMRKKGKSEEEVSCMRLDSLLIIHVLCQSLSF